MQNSVRLRYSLSVRFQLSAFSFLSVSVLVQPNCWMGEETPRWYYWYWVLELESEDIYFSNSTCHLATATPDVDDCEFLAGPMYKAQPNKTGIRC